METILCEASALQYWRTPPLVREIAGSRLPSDTLRWISDRELFSAQVGIARERPVLSEFGSLDRVGRPVESGSLEGLLASLDRLMPSVESPVDVLVDHADERRRSSLVRPHVWARPLSEGALVPVGEGLWVTSPAFTLLQLAGRLSLARCALLASELCGTFSVHEAPSSVAELLERLNGQRRLVRVGGWEPSFTQEGRLTDVWSRQPVASVEELVALAESQQGARGSRRLAAAARLVVPGAASPLEVRAGVLLGWPRRLGGEGLGGFTHNERVELSPEAQAVARRESCSCDLYWPGGEGRGPLDVECQSEAFHAGTGGRMSDANRSTALGLMGVEVVEVTWGQLRDPVSCDALARLVAEKLGRGLRERSRGLLEKRERLREEVLMSWDDIARR